MLYVNKGVVLVCHMFIQSLYLHAYFLFEVYELIVFMMCIQFLISNIRMHQWTVFVTFSYQQTLCDIH